MKGRTPNKKEKEFHNKMAQLGCIACRIDGRSNFLVSIHHIAGRTNPDAHWLVLPLCASHHQQDTGPDRSAIAVHPYKARFESMYGNQYDLLETCKKLIEGTDT